MEIKADLDTAGLVERSEILRRTRHRRQVSSCRAHSLDESQDQVAIRHITQGKEPGVSERREHGARSQCLSPFFDSREVEGTAIRLDLHLQIRLGGAALQAVGLTTAAILDEGASSNSRQGLPV